MSVYKEHLKLQSHGGTPSYINVTPQVRAAIENSGIKEGICVVISPHTTCGVFFEEFVHDITPEGDEFLQADLNDVLKKIIAKCNAHAVDLDVSIHFNSGAGDKSGNRKTTGVECYIYSSTSKAKAFAEKICQAISNLGFKNRGVKISQKLYVLKKSKAPALLVECCFVDDKDDVQLYSYEEMADAIVYGITGEHVQIEPETDKAEQGEETSTGDRKALYRVQVGAYSARYNAEAQAEKLRKAGFDAAIVQA